MPMPNTCAHCRHCRVILNTEKEATPVCKRYPPTACAALILANGQPTWQSATVWPSVSREDTCGEFEAENVKLVAS